MTRALTFVTDSSSIDAVPSIKNGNQQSHTFCLGAMGLHSYLAKHHIEYGSPESIEFTNIYFMLMNYWTLFESNNIARERPKSGEVIMLRILVDPRLHEMSVPSLTNSCASLSSLGV